MKPSYARPAANQTIERDKNKAGQMTPLPFLPKPKPDPDKKRPEGVYALRPGRNKTHFTVFP